MTAGDVLWTPDPDAWVSTRMGRFLTAAGVGASEGWGPAWRWSIENLDAFWGAVWQDAGLGDPPDTVLADGRMPGATWFPDVSVNVADHLLRWTGPQPAIIARSDTREDIALSRDQLRAEVARVAKGLRDLGVRTGDRVVGYLPNIPEAVVAFLATASLGAVWSSCAPEFGTTSVIDRVAQIEPTVLLVADGYRYGDREVPRVDEVARIREALPTLRATVVLGHIDGQPDLDAFPGAVDWQALGAGRGEPTFAEVPFDHPLYVLYSSGTTGRPKAIVHGHGGILLEHHKALALHTDLGEGDRFFWFSTTGWMMWNYLVSGLGVGAAIVLFDGDPAHPDLDRLWQYAEDAGITYLGLGAPFIHACQRAGLRPGTDHDLSSLRGVGSTGAPLSPAGFRWITESVGERVQPGSLSGGTDLCTGFVGPSPLLPVREGEISCRMLGAAVESWSPDGTPLVGATGELVITRPMPSMPVHFWDDEDGSRYQDAYFSMWPGVWRHGDWLEITPEGGCIVSGRSDSTLNRGGIRMGTAEFYAIVEALPEITDSLVVHLDHDEQDRLLLFVVPADGVEFDEQLESSLRAVIRQDVSPRHVPDEIREIAAVPRTISGKKMEVPIKRILTGVPVEEAANPGAMANPESLTAFAP